MKKIIILIAFVMVSLNGCEYEDDPLSKINVGEIKNYLFEENIEINSIDEAFIYSHDRIKYLNENKDYWQLPEETFFLGTGDCEDMAIFFMYLCETKLKISCELVLVKNSKGSSHTLVFIEQTRKLYDVNKSCVSINIVSGWREVWSCSYDKTIWMTYYYHNNVGEYY